MLQAKLAELPEELQRELFTAFRLEIRYDVRLGVALIRITLDYETIEGVAEMAEELPGNENRHLPEAGACAEDLVSAPGRIRTCGTRFRRAVLYPLSYGGMMCISKPSERLGPLAPPPGVSFRVPRSPAG